MTEKRFYNDGQYVMQNGEVYVICNGKHNADVVATALNELIEERNKLQFDYNMEILTRQSIEKENEQLKEENKQLKRQNKHLSDTIECLERGSCRSIDSFIDSYCSDELLNEYDLFYGDVE